MVIAGIRQWYHYQPKPAPSLAALLVTPTLIGHAAILVSVTNMTSSSTGNSSNTRYCSVRTGMNWGHNGSNGSNSNIKVNEPKRYAWICWRWTRNDVRTNSGKRKPNNYSQKEAIIVRMLTLVIVLIYSHRYNEICNSGGRNRRSHWNPARHSNHGGHVS